MRLSIGTSAPARAAAHVIRLFSNRLEDIHSDLDAGFGFDVLRLSAHDCATIAALQADAFLEERGEDCAAALIDRLSGRLGEKNVMTLGAVDTHLPERAVSYAPALRSEAKSKAPPPLERLRPLRLLARPEAIAVMAEIPDGPPLRFEWRRVSYRIVKASGPERIEDEWWREKGRPARDYYRVETAEGRRFWLFRAGFYGDENKAPEWRLHGFFP
ncbi:MAG: hypothetical protein R3C60_14255 [Parvularculaceae bacterium]